MIRKKWLLTLSLLSASVAHADHLNLTDTDITKVSELVLAKFDGTIIAFEPPAPRGPNIEPNENGFYEMSELLGQIRLKGVWVVILENGKSASMRVPVYYCPPGYWSIDFCPKAAFEGGT